MGYYYLPLDKRNEKDFPSKLKFICISEPIKPTPEKGKKTVTKDKREEYKRTLERYKRTIEALESGHVNMHNNKIQTDNIIDFGIRFIFSGYKARMFWIKPVQSEREWQGNKYYVSEFDVIKEIKTEDDLLKILVSKYDYSDFIEKAFEQGTYSNEGYREKSIEIIGKLNRLASSDTYASKQHLNDLISNNINYPYQDCSVKNLNKNAHDFVIELLDRDLIILCNENDSKQCLVERLLRLKWTDLALKVVKSEFITDKDIAEIRDRRQIKELLTYMTDNKEAREIIKLVGLEPGIMTLVVSEDYDDGYRTREVERKEFTNMNELRSYLITEYHVPFDIASEDVDDMTYEDYTFNLEQ